MTLVRRNEGARRTNVPSFSDLSNDKGEMLSQTCRRPVITPAMRTVKGEECGRKRRCKEGCKIARNKTLQTFANKLSIKISTRAADDV